MEMAKQTEDRVDAAAVAEAVKPSAAVASPSKWCRDARLMIGDYEAADALHGWTAHIYHQGRELKITQDAFKQAIAAAKSPPPCKPHIAATKDHDK